MAKKICLDAGHYGKYNRSPIVPEYYESDMNWKLHLLLKQYLEQYGFEVITTRKDQETDKALYDRGIMAKKCDLFMSLHSNAAYSTKEFQENNNSHKNEYVDRVDIYVTLDGKVDDLGIKLANKIAEVMETNQGGSIKTREHNGGEYYGVLRGSAAVNVPGMLVEHSFHTNARSATWLLNDNNLDKLAKAEAAVLAEYFGLANDSINFTLIEGKAKATVEQMQTYIKKIRPNTPQSVIDMIPFYLSEGEVEGIRGDIAFAQSCLETGNFEFEGSAVTLDQNNFCGLGVTEKGIKGNSFDTPQLGIRAQIQHLKSYANKEPLVNEKIDPRFDKVKRGNSPYVEWLGAKENPEGRGWASGEGYGYKILNILDRILSTETPKKLGSRNLRVQTTGEDVKELQKLLIQLEYDLGSTKDDGIYGEKTEQAVKSFQEKNNLEPDGIYGPKTHEKLMSLFEVSSEPEISPEEPEKEYLLIIQNNLPLLQEIQSKYGGKIMINI